MELTERQLKDYILTFEPRGLLRFGLFQYKLEEAGFTILSVESIWWPKSHFEWVRRVRLFTSLMPWEGAKLLRKIYETVEDKENGMLCELDLISAHVPYKCLQSHVML